MQSNKFAQQVTRFMDTRKVSNKEMAKSIPVSNGQFSNMKNGTRVITMQARKAISNLAHDITINYSAAREDYGTISVMIRPGKTRDMLQALTQQSEEQEQREGIQTAFLRAAVTDPPNRSTEQRLIIKQFLKELIEEIGSEITLLIRCCKYLRVDPIPYIDAYNEKMGG